MQSLSGPLRVAVWVQLSHFLSSSLRFAWIRSRLPVDLNLHCGPALAGTFHASGYQLAFLSSLTLLLPQLSPLKAPLCPRWAIPTVACIKWSCSWQLRAIFAKIRRNTLASPSRSSCNSSPSLSSTWRDVRACVSCRPRCAQYELWRIR